MAKLSARGRHEVDRWFDYDHGCLKALMSDGRILARYAFSGWKEYSKFSPKPDGKVQNLEDYLALVVRINNRKADQPRSGIRCDCADVHDLRAWGKAGRPEPCPCPNPVRYSSGPELTRTITHFPSQDSLHEWSFDSVAEAVDGCQVEPDGVCPHGSPSWLKCLHLI